MATWNDLIEQLQRLDNFAKTIQAKPEMLPSTIVAEEELVTFQSDYQEWYTDCLSRLEGELKSQFQLEYERLAQPFILHPCDFYEAEQEINNWGHRYSLYVFKWPYALFFQKSAFNHKTILLQASKVQADPHLEKAIKLIDSKIDLFKRAIEEASTNDMFNSTYHTAYYGTETLLSELFSDKEIDKFRMATRTYSDFDDPLTKLSEYKGHINLCISQLEVYKERIENFGLTRTRNYQDHTASNIYAKEFHMGDIINTSMGNVSNSGQLFTGKINEVTATLTASNQQNLAEALKNIQEEIAASSYLTEEEKQDHIDVIAEIGEQAASPQPNKTKLKRLIEWLIPALRRVPDIAKAIESAEPLLKNIHL